MILSRLNLFLAVLLVLVIVAITMTQVDHSQPNYEFLPDMKHSPASSAFSKNPNFPNGQTLQAPVSGTIPRGELPLHYTNSKEDAIRAGEELKNQYEIDIFASKEAVEKLKKTSKNQAPDSRQKKTLDKLTKKYAEAQTALQNSSLRGAEKYNTYCIVCHGPSGNGDGPVAKRGFPPPPSLLTGKSRTEMKDGQLFHIMSYGQESMQNFAAQLTQKQRWDILNYIRSIQSKAPTVEPQPKKEVPDNKDTPDKKEVPDKKDASKSDEKAITDSKKDSISYPNKKDTEHE